MCGCVPDSVGIAQAAEESPEITPAPSGWLWIPKQAEIQEEFGAIDNKEALHYNYDK